MIDYACIITNDARIGNIPSYSGKGGRMDNYDLELKSLQLQNERVLRVVEEVAKLLKVSQENKIESKEFYTIEECAALKGGAAENTFKANRFLLPGCGNPKYCVYVAGRLAFPRKEVERWRAISDSAYIEYAHSCGVTKIPEKYHRLALKAKEKTESIK